MPLARKPITGMTAIAAMRVRTETLEMSRVGVESPVNGSGMAVSRIAGDRQRARPTGCAAQAICG
jgi:hypothetical protein